MLTAAEIDTRRHQARKREIVERILLSVEQLLEETESYLSLKVEQIIKRSGMGRTTFYRYFNDKNELLLALSEPALEDVLHAALDPWQMGPATTREEFERETRRGMDLYRPHIALMNALVEVSTYDANVKKHFRAFFDDVRDGIAGHLRRGQDEGFIRPDLDAHHTAGWLTWMAERGMNQLVAAADADEIDDIVHSFTGLVWNATHASG